MTKLVHEEEKPPFAPGSLLRTVWYDEVFPRGSYDADINSGWKPKGVLVYREFEGWTNPLYDLEDDPATLTIPFNTPGLLYVDYHVDNINEVVWYQVVWGDRTVWIIRDWVALIKKTNHNSL